MRILNVTDEVWNELEAAVISQREFIGVSIIDAHDQEDEDEVNSLIETYDAIGEVFGLEAFDRTILEHVSC